jgi:hypothetical protein
MTATVAAGDSNWWIGIRRFKCEDQSAKYNQSRDGNGAVNQERSRRDTARDDYQWKYTASHKNHLVKIKVIGSSAAVTA